MGKQSGNTLTSSSGVRVLGVDADPYAILTAVLQAVPHSVSLVGLDGTILYMNRDFPGTAEGQWVGRSLFELLPEESHEIARHVLVKVAESGEPGQFGTRRVTPAGEAVQYLTRVAPVRQGERVSALALGSVEIAWSRRTEAAPDERARLNMAERRHLEDQLLQAQKMEAVGQLTAGVAHNFNNLLTVITPNLEIALENAPMQIRPELIDASEAAHRAAELVRQLTHLSHRRGERTAREQLAAHAVLEQVVSICRCTFDSRIRIVFETDGELPDIFVAPGEIEQALVNICLNARDALEDAQELNPELRILAHAEDSADGTGRRELCIRVEDNGSGMDGVTQRRCFEPFFTTKEVGRGTGLGLASAYGIVTEHHGSLECESMLGSGTVFTIRLPAAAAELRSAAGVKRPFAQRTSTKQRRLRSR